MAALNECCTEEFCERERERESLGDCKGWYSGNERIVSGELERRDGLKGGKGKEIGSELRLYIV